LSNEVDVLLDKMIDYNEICNLHYNSDVTDEQISKWLSDGFNYVVNSVSLSPNNTLTVPEIRDIVFDRFLNELTETNKSLYNNSLETRGECSWLKSIACGIFGSVAEACGLAGIAVAAVAPPAAIACVASMGAGAVACIADCWN